MSGQVHWRVTVVDGEGMTAIRQVYLDAEERPEDIVAESIDSYRRSRRSVEYPLSIHIWREDPSDA